MTTLRTSLSAIATARDHGNAIRLASIAGIGGSHELWWLTELDRLVYVITPESGPVTAMAGYAADQRDWPAWPVPEYRTFPTRLEYAEALMAAQRLATEYVMREALDEVAAEHDLPVPGWRA